MAFMARLRTAAGESPLALRFTFMSRLRLVRRKWTRAAADSAVAAARRGRNGGFIITVSTNVLTSGKLKLAPDLPKRHLDAATKLKLGSRDHVALELTGNPLGLRVDELVFQK